MPQDNEGIFFYPPSRLPLAQPPALVSSGPLLGGVNNSIDPQYIDFNESAGAQNVSQDTLGRTEKRQGFHAATLHNSGITFPLAVLVGLRPDNGTTKSIIIVQAEKTYRVGSLLDSGFTPPAWTLVTGTTMVSTSDPSEVFALQAANKIFVFKRGTNVRVIDSSLNMTLLASGTTLPPDGDCAEYMNGRILVSKNNIVYYSDPINVYQFSHTTDAVKFDEGRDGRIIAIKKRKANELFVFLDKAIELLVEDFADSTLFNYNVTSWRREILEPGVGCAARDSVVVYGEDIIFLDNSFRMRRVSRTVLDVQQGIASTPLSIKIEKTFPGNINRQLAKYTQSIIFDNKLFIAYTSAGALYNDSIAVYDFRYDAFISHWTGINVQKWLVSDINQAGNFKLYFSSSVAIDAVDDVSIVYQLLDGEFQDNRPNNSSEPAGTAIEFIHTTKAYDFGFPASDKIWHWLEIEVAGAVSGSVDVYMVIDERDPVFVGSVNMTGADPPALDDNFLTDGPPQLPVQLVDQPRVRKRFHLESKKRGKAASLQFVNDDADSECRLIGYRFGAIVENVELER